MARKASGYVDNMLFMGVLASGHQSRKVLTGLGIFVEYFRRSVLYEKARVPCTDVASFHKGDAEAAS